jgi:hypothetical protein
VSTREQFLSARVAQLEQQLRDAGIVPASAPNAGPGQEEVDRLAAIVASKYPVLALKGERDRLGFALALIYLQTARRVPDPVTRYATAFWVAEAERTLGAAGGISVKAFAAAAVASRVAYADLARFPYDCAWGLSQGTGARSLAWRETLTTRDIPPPTKVHPAPERRGPQAVDIRGGNAAVGPYGVGY